jgi:hypothetical protein
MVITTADERLEAARVAVDTAVKSLGEIVVNRVEGTREFTDSAMARFRESLSKLIEVRDRLG